VSRLALERTQIAVLKALGYSDGGSRGTTWGCASIVGIGAVPDRARCLGGADDPAVRGLKLPGAINRLAPADRGRRIGPRPP
jgi:hypothetical protein